MRREWLIRKEVNKIMQRPSTTLLRESVRQSPQIPPLFVRKDKREREREREREIDPDDSKRIFIVWRGT